MMRPSREAVGIGARIAALQVNLVRAHAIELDQSRTIEIDAAIRTHVDPGQPSGDPVGVELLIPRAIERIGHVKTLAVAADLDHLRRAVERPVRTRWMRLAA